MSKAQSAFAVILALMVGYAAGFSSFLLRHPFWKRSVIDGGPKAQEEAPAVFVHPIIAEIARARKLREAGQSEGAQKLLQEQLQLYPKAPETDRARDLLGEINTELFFGSTNHYGKIAYVVQRGDSLARIARRLKSTPEMIMRTNDLDSAVIHPGETLLVPDGEFSIVVDLPGESVVVQRDGGFFKQYPIQSSKLPRSSQSRLTTKVTSILFWKDGSRVSGAEAREPVSTPWLQLALGGYTLYGVEDASSQAGINTDSLPHSTKFEGAAAVGSAVSDVPPLGIGLFTGDVAELLLLVSRGTPVTILREEKRLAHQ